MKRLGGLFDRIARRDNLAAAAYSALRVHRYSRDARRFAASLEQRLGQIGTCLAAGRYVFSPCSRFTVRDTKTRVIHAPVFADRVVHHAIVRVTGPAFLKGAQAHSYACIAGRGHHRAVWQAQRWIRRADWYAKVDVRAFYDSVDHDTLRQLLRRRFREHRLLDLFDAVLHGYCSAPGRGLPIGALTSQWLGNFYLDELDRRIKSTGMARRYLRYLDDVLVLGSRDGILQLRPVFHAELARLQLEAKHGGEWNRAAQGVPWLGFRLFHDRIRLNPVARRRLRRRCRALKRQYQRGEIDERRYQAIATSLFAHASHAGDASWRRRVLECHDCSAWPRSGTD